MFTCDDLHLQYYACIMLKYVKLCSIVNTYLLTYYSQCFVRGYVCMLMMTYLMSIQQLSMML